MPTRPPLLISKTCTGRFPIDGLCIHSRTTSPPVPLSPVPRGCVRGGVRGIFTQASYEFAHALNICALLHIATSAYAHDPHIPAALSASPQFTALQTPHSIALHRAGMRRGMDREAIDNYRRHRRRRPPWRHRLQAPNASSTRHLYTGVRCQKTSTPVSQMRGRHCHLRACLRRCRWVGCLSLCIVRTGPSSRLI